MVVVKTHAAVAAVDVGASSGRVITVHLGPGRLDLGYTHRFTGGPIALGHATGTTLHTDILGTYRDVLNGIIAAHREQPLDSIGIDTWAVDYGLLDKNGELLGNPIQYRDERTAGAAAEINTQLSANELYATTGIAQQPFNTIYQLWAEKNTERSKAASALLLIPDLLAYFLTGKKSAERTNASTTGLYDANQRGWADHIISQLDLPRHLLPSLISPGQHIGHIQAHISETTGLPPLPVTAVGSHDTASAVVAVPFKDREKAAYISSGTWSLVGLELNQPVLSETARTEGFTNEAGVDNTIRFLRNVMGLWVLSETIKEWESQGTSQPLPELLNRAAQEPPLASVIDINHPRFFTPGPMIERIAEACRENGQSIPAPGAPTVRCLLDSLALAYRRSVYTASSLTGQNIDVIHIVGGGAQNSLLCQLTADACGIPVEAGPFEATAIGNALVQGRALGIDLPDLDAMRTLVRTTHQLQRYTPNADTTGWDRAQLHLEETNPRRAQ